MTDAFNGTFPVTEIESAVDVNAVILGVPFEDNAKIYKKGAANAPDKIREMSQFFSGQSFEKSSIHTQNVLDLGNLPTNLDYKQLTNLLSKKTKEIIEKDTMPIILGGDHSITLGTAQGMDNKDFEFDGIVWIDAHVDLMDQYPESESYSRATVLRRILELEQFAETQVYFIGCRGHNLGIEEVEFIADNEMRTLLAKDFNELTKANEFLDKIIGNHKNLYVSIDIDVLDPAFAPGVSVPEPGGLTSRELFFVVQKLAKIIACLEIVEVNPSLDLNNLTSMTASKLIYELMDFRV